MRDIGHRQQFYLLRRGKVELGGDGGYGVDGDYGGDGGYGDEGTDGYDTRSDLDLLRLNALLSVVCRKDAPYVGTTASTGFVCG